MLKFTLIVATTLANLLTLVLAAQVPPASESNGTSKTTEAAPRGIWTVDRIHSRIGFSVAHFTITQVTGYFRDFDGRVSCTCPTDDFTGGTVEFTARTASVFTGNKQRDGHLRSDAFFNAERYPELKFAGILLKEAGKNELKGKLTVRGVTKPISLDVSYNGRIKDRNLGIEKAGFKITGKVNRFEFGLKWNETFEGGGSIVGEEVGIEVNVEIDRKSPVNGPARSIGPMTPNPAKA